jgi:hypothetical protein
MFVHPRSPVGRDFTAIGVGATLSSGITLWDLHAPANAARVRLTVRELEAVACRRSGRLILRFRA